VRYLNDCLRHLVEERLPEEIDLLCLMGDLVDGEQRKSRGTGLFTTKLAEQVEGAIELLRPIAQRAKRIVRVDGTPYHEDFSGVVRILDSELGVGHYAQIIDLELPGGVMNLAHHPAGGSALYMGTKVDKEALWSTIAASRNKVPLPRWIIRSHLHEYMLQDSQHSTVMILPAWQLPTPWAKKGNYWRWQPTIGAVLALRDDDAPGGYLFRPLLYDPPMPGTTNLTEVPRAATRTALMG